MAEIGLFSRSQPSEWLFIVQVEVTTMMCNKKMQILCVCVCVFVCVSVCVSVCEWVDRVEVKSTG